MRPVESYYPKLFAGTDCSLTAGETRRDHAEVTIDADEAIMLHKHFEPARALVLSADESAGCGRQDRSSNRGRQIDTVVVGPDQGFVRQYTRTKGRRDAGGTNGA